jgi:PAS domain S-box-containing protein
MRAADGLGLSNFISTYVASYDVVEDAVAAELATALPTVFFAELRALERACLARAGTGDVEASFRSEGAACAAAGLPLSFWRERSAAHVRNLVPLLYDAYGAAPHQLVRAILGMQQYFAQQFAAIAEGLLAEQQGATRLWQERSRAAFEDSPLTMWIYDTTTLRIVHANHAARAHYGYSLEEFQQLTVPDLWPPEDREKVMGYVNQPPARSTVSGRQRRKDGSTFWIESYGSAYPDVHRKTRLAVLKDVTQERIVENARHRAEVRFERLSDSGVVGILIMNFDDLRVIDINQALCDMLKYSREEFLSGAVDWKTLTPAEWAPADAVAMAQLRANGLASLREKEYLRKDGTRCPILIASALVGASETISCVLDLTERKKLERQFLRSQRMESVGTLAGGIAHDLNNVLAPILMSIELLRDLAKSDQDLQLLDNIYVSARRGADLIKQVLTFARGVEGERLLIGPQHIVGELLKILRDTLPKSIDVRFSAASDLWNINGDSTQLHQVFLNLCVNARDAMPDGGTLKLTMANVVLDENFAAMCPGALPGAYVLTQVEDTGSGIPPEIRERIFEPFFTTKDVGKGTGLGLSTSLGIVKSHGGFINVYSQPGRGTRFTVYLPASSGDVKPVADEGRLPGLPRGRGELILVVDDEPAIRTIVRRMLEQFGYRVLLAANGVEAVEQYSAHGAEIAAVLTDMSMPIMDGAALIAVLEKMNARVRIIRSSGLDMIGDISKAVGGAVKAFVPKPYTAEALLVTLRDILREM